MPPQGAWLAGDAVSGLSLVGGVARRRSEVGQGVERGFEVEAPFLEIVEFTTSAHTIERLS